MNFAKLSKILENVKFIFGLLQYSVDHENISNAFPTIKFSFGTSNSICIFIRVASTITNMATAPIGLFCLYGRRHAVVVSRNEYRNSSKAR